MSSGFIRRVFGLALLVSAALTAAQTGQAAQAHPASQSVAGDCERRCLQQALDSYLNAVFSHDPGAAALATDHYATEDSTPVATGEGFWKDVSGYGSIQRRYVDAVKGSAAFFGLLKENGQDVIASVRIRVIDHKIAEAEWMLAHTGLGGVGQPYPAGIEHHPPPAEVLPPARRSPRYALISLANNYFQAVKDHDGSWVPASAECIRIENGVGTPNAAKAGVLTGLPATAGAGAGVAAPPPDPAAVEPLKGQCLENFVSFKHLTKELAFRRFLVVDEAAGVVVTSAIFVRYPTSAARHNLVHEYFLIRDGKIAGIWTSMYYLPKGAVISNGWEDREDR